MNANRPTGSEGFTLVEVVMAMVLMVVVMGLVVSAYMFATKAVGSWQRGLDLETTSHLIVQRLSTDLRQAQTVRLIDPDSVELGIPGQARSLVYAMRDSSLFRNSVSMMPNQLRLTEFEVGPGMADSVSATSDTTISRVKVVFALASDGRSIRREVFVASRAQEDWSPPAER